MSSLDRAVVGLDIGGTHSRVVVADLGGRILARASGAGANRWSSARSLRATITATTTDALQATRDLEVVTAVVGIAGWGDPSEVTAALAGCFASQPHPPHVQVVVDVVANHAAGSTARQGWVLAAGTGTIAAEVDDARVVHRVDGCGWLFGDEGSAVWIGVAAVRAALRALDGRGPSTELTATVAAFLAPDVARDAASDDLRQVIVETGLSRPPAELGQLAPDVVVVAQGGDEQARRIVSDAVEQLATTARAAVLTGSPSDLVLAGSLLLAPGPIQRGVVASLRRIWPSVAFTGGHDGAAGAAALALRGVTGEPLSEATHRGLCDPIPIAGS